MTKIKHFGAAASSTAAVELYHVVGMTPEARTVEQAFCVRKTATLRISGNVNDVARPTNASISAGQGQRKVDYVMLGCPHNTIEEKLGCAQLLDERKVRREQRVVDVYAVWPSRLWRTATATPDIIEKAGGEIYRRYQLFGHFPPDAHGHQGDRIRFRQAGPLSAGHPGAQSGAGSALSEDCVEAAVTGRWNWVACDEPDTASNVMIVCVGAATSVPGVVEGEALVTRDPISGWGGIDPRTGTVIETRHELRGQSFEDKVLVFPGAKGSSGWSAHYSHTARPWAWRLAPGCSPG